MTLADKNNNPLNIRVSKANWIGKKGEYKGFVSFENKIFGYRAAFKTLLSYRRIHGLKTIRTIIHRWCPEGDGANKPEEYITFVSQQANINPDKELTTEDYKKIVKAMALQEGSTMVSESEIECGYRISNFKL